MFHTTAVSCGLLKGIDPVLTADLLHVLRSAGHGDNIVVVDCNFPAAQVASCTTTGKHIELAGVNGGSSSPRVSFYALYSESWLLVFPLTLLHLLLLRENTLPS